MDIQLLLVILNYIDSADQQKWKFDDLKIGLIRPDFWRSDLEAGVLKSGEIPKTNIFNILFLIKIY
jgi:hypothetical protein